MWLERFRSFNWCGFFVRFFFKIIAVVFHGLILIFHFWHHLFTVFFQVFDYFRCILLCVYTAVFSANWALLQCIRDINDVAFKQNRSEDETLWDSCLNGSLSWYTVSYFNLKFTVTEVRCNCTYVLQFGRLSLNTFFNKPLCRTLSKAFSMFSHTIPVHVDFLKPCMIFSVIRGNWWDVECCVLNPHWWLGMVCLSSSSSLSTL